jgi:hypothetical protein
MAARLGSITIRRALELGLHRRSTVSRCSANSHSPVNALNVFWTSYVLDRQWSFAVGLPQSLRDEEIDSDLPEPVSNPDFMPLSVIHSHSDYDSKGTKANDTCVYRIARRFYS